MTDALLTLTEVSFRYPGAPQPAVQQVRHLAQMLNHKMTTSLTLTLKK